MRFSRNWIADYTNLPGDLKQLSHTLSMLGLVVDDARPAGDDLLLDLDLPANRPDVMNHFEIARELSIALAAELRHPATEHERSGGPTSEIASLRIQDPDGCSRFLARAMLHVKVGPSPAWLRERLEAIGLRPINNVVDTTNFVMWELGRPMHAYDLDKLHGQALIVRRARSGETLVTLDEVERKLDDQDLVIADESGPVGLAGVMGGMGTGVTETTRRVLLECACFDPTTIRRMARRHGLHTDASHRFERGMSIQGIGTATDRATRLILGSAGGEACAQDIDETGTIRPQVEVDLPLQRVPAYLGVDVPRDRVQEILEALGFDVQVDAGTYRLQVPRQRCDVALPEDVLEEIARFYGYDRLPSTLPLLRRSEGRGLSPQLRDEAQVRRVMWAQGYWEAMTFVFTSPEEQGHFLPPGVEPVRLVNPLSEAMSVLRHAIVPGLLASVARNLNQGAGRVRLFEIGRTFAPSEPADGPPTESRHVALVATGPAPAPHYGIPSRPYGFGDLKGAVQTLNERMGWPTCEWRPDTVPGLQAGLCASLWLDGRAIGAAGKLDPDVAARFGIDAPVWAAEVDVDGQVGGPMPELKVSALPRFPASSRDVSLLVPSQVAFADLEQEIANLPALPLEQFQLLDVYRGDDLPADHVSLTLRLTYRSSERTLTTQEIEAAHESVVAHLESALGARRR